MNFTKITEKLNTVEENSTRAVNQTTHLTNELTRMKEQFAEMKKMVVASQDAQKEFHDNFKTMHSQIHMTNKEFQEDLSDFKIIKGKLQSDVLQTLADEFRNELLQHVEKLKVDMTSYNALKSQVERITAKTESLSTEIEKFTAISRNIKKEDFEMKNVAKQIADADKEKLRLLKKVDMLERLLSKERRNAYKKTVL